ncbi:hypothetical protein ACQ33O_03900 [Ferruginibacter sp. SUN002]|uniref:hypothetical protein n=1 Tax=Ferruginibacter sp. SUN002 TaxID=2937789 RepID=UPI003D36B788
MGRTKEKKKILHEPSTHEIFGCISRTPTYSKLLLENGPEKTYTAFLSWLIEKDFYNDKYEKISIKKMAADFKADSTKATIWIKEIYQDIFELNNDRPELFQNNDLKVSLYMKSYDNSCCFSTCMSVLPREFETVRFPFVHAKIGTDYFWVKKVEHEIEDNKIATTLWLEGGFVNKYREFALDKALFEGWIHFMDVYEKHSFELDNEIKKIYRNVQHQPKLYDNYKKGKWRFIK